MLGWTGRVGSRGGEGGFRVLSARLVAGFCREGVGAGGDGVCCEAL